MTNSKAQLQTILEEHDQQHLLRFWDELSAEEQSAFAKQIEAVDFQMLADIRERAAAAQPESAPEESRADRASAPGSVIRQPQSPEDESQWQAAAERGVSMLSDGRCAVITVAGGQGTRLGFDQPKGMFPIGPISDRTLFQIFAEQIQAIRNKYSCELPWLIMTSQATHEDTQNYFESQDYFGMPRDSVSFFCQASLPATDAATGRLLLGNKGSLSLTPDGHGGVVAALDRAGLLSRLSDSGIDYLYYHQVDNPTVCICDPAFIGFHMMKDSQMTTLVAKKSSPTERMGVLVDIDGGTEIIEYSELSPEQAEKTDDSGQWIFWAGNTAVHGFDRKFLESLAQGDTQLPLHIARKKVAYVDDSGQPVTPSENDQPNAIKLERFIFDALPLAERTLIVEGNREREFNPVKNAEGADSPATARDALNRNGRAMLRAAGADVGEDVAVEISPLVEDDLKTHLEEGTLSLSQLTSSPADAAGPR